MSEELGLIYINLSQLLDDICLFLRDGVNKEIFSSETQKQAETLIKRSKIQLQQISNITNGECYMQMEEQKTLDDNNEDEEVEGEDDLIYMDAEDEKQVPEVDNDVCPFAGVPVKDLSLDDKHGFIYMKTKFIFGFEKLKRIYAVIHKDWFLIYSNDKDSKPCHTYCLKTHKAQMIPTTKQGEHETQFFALINQETKQKWQFLAQTHKDMLQWITKINRYNQNDERQPNRTEKSTRIEPVPVIETCINDEEESEGEHYDTVILKVENGRRKEVQLEDEDDEIYEVIRPQSPHKSLENPIPKPEMVNLPNRRQQTPLPPLPVERKKSSESLVSYDNPVSMEQWDKQSIISETPSFSEDEEQEIYDVLVAASPTMQDNKEERVSINLTETNKKEVTVSPLISSLKEKLLQASPPTMQSIKPPPPKRLSNERKLSINSIGSSNKDQSPKAVALRNPFRPTSSNNSPTSPTVKVAFPKLNVQPKPSPLTKPKIDVKLIKPTVNTKSSTKQVMKLAKEISLK